MQLIRLSLIIVIAVLLTIITQIGGVVFLLSVWAYKLTVKYLQKRSWRLYIAIGSFVIFYLFLTLIIVPPVARKFGRVPLPLLGADHVQPVTIWTGLLNRNYVRPALKESIYRVAAEIQTSFPGMTVNYLDANFPFGNGFPLVPHLSHSDGKKLDLAFTYNNAATGTLSNEVPSYLGYGVCESPVQGEINMPDICAGKGFWQYNLLADYTSQQARSRLVFDSRRNTALLNLLAQQISIGKIFIEPHLKSRLGLTSAKIRFHGCQAVRHDDHIHVQLK